MKIFVNGKRNSKLERDYVGRFTSFKRRVKNFFRMVLIVSGIITIGFVLIVLGGYINPAIKYQTVIAEKDNLSPKVNDIKDKVINDIQKCESAGHTENDGIIIFDNNRVASVGTLQFQVSTVIFYYKKLYGKDITPKEAILIALDDNKAEALAKDIVFKDSKGWRNWYNCGNKTNAETKLKVINELLK